MRTTSGDYPENPPWVMNYAAAIQEIQAPFRRHTAVTTMETTVVVAIIERSSSFTGGSAL